MLYLGDGRGEVRVEAEGGTRKAGRNGVVWSMFVRLFIGVAIYSLSKR